MVCLNLHFTCMYSGVDRQVDSTVCSVDSRQLLACEIGKQRVNSACFLRRLSRVWVSLGGCMRLPAVCNLESKH